MHKYRRIGCGTPLFTFSNCSHELLIEGLSLGLVLVFGLVLGLVLGLVNEP